MKIIRAGSCLIWSFHQLSVADPGFLRRGPSPWGDQHTILPKFRKKRHEIERIWTPGGVPRVPLRSATGYSGLHFRIDPVKLEYLSHIHYFTPVSP